MANRSSKPVVSARVSIFAAELLRVLREDSGRAVPAIIEDALKKAASSEQIARARLISDSAESKARIAAAADRLNSTNLSASEMKEAISLASKRIPSI